ncbi:uncharacterized protein BDV14DRAFT_199417 [Aspergillus stella-maris]|uniref:uncharacterized protein n=1 Tax=Aspergillus stella-maris TaxID=1810926 RepID=UPI003CCD79CA
MARRALTDDQKSWTTGNAARIRDNQRRSRARRKDYIRELEERVQSYEKLGVTAMQEVQAAGRKVAQENKWLRELLGLHGISDLQINHYLASRVNENAVPTPPELAKQGGHGKSTTTLSTKQHAHQHVLMSSSAAFSGEEPVPQDRIGSGQADVDPDGLPLNQYITTEQHVETSMPCEAAANIIAGMHIDSARLAGMNPIDSEPQVALAPAPSYLFQDVEKQSDSACPQKKQSAFNNLGILDRFLIIWIFLAMAVGIILANFVPSTGPALQRGKFVGVSVPIGLAGGDGDYCAILVAVNSLLQMVLFAPHGVFVIQVISGDAVSFEYATAAKSVAVFL